MANTALLQAVAQMLMQGRPPSPIAPVPSGPMTPPGGTFPGLPAWTPPPVMPEPAPVAPAPALDQNLIAQLTGPRPVAPVEQPVSLFQKIALALQGFGAGVQGQGPQFLAALQERRERPRREFQAQTEAFEDRRRRATVFAEEKQRRGQQDIQRQADIQSAREFQTFEMGERDRMQEARDLRLQAKQLEREEVKAKADLAEQQRKEKAQQERDARLIARDFGKVGAKPAVAKNLGDYYAGLTDTLSSEAAKFESAQARLAEIRANKAASGGTGSGASSGDAASLERQFNALKAQFLRAEKPTEGARFGDRALQTRIAAQLPAIMNKLEKLGYEVGYDPSGIYPYIKPPSARNQPAAQPTAQAGPVDAEAQAYAQRFNISVEQARKELAGQ